MCDPFAVHAVPGDAVPAPSVAMSDDAPGNAELEAMAASSSAEIAPTTTMAYAVPSVMAYPAPITMLAQPVPAAAMAYAPANPMLSAPPAPQMQMRRVLTQDEIVPGAKRRRSSSGYSEPPPGWVTIACVSVNGIKYSRYTGPHGKRAQSMAEAWRIHNKAAGLTADSDAGQPPPAPVTWAPVAALPGAPPPGSPSALASVAQELPSGTGTSQGHPDGGNPAQHPDGVEKRRRVTEPKELPPGWECIHSVTRCAL